MTGRRAPPADGVVGARRSGRAARVSVVSGLAAIRLVAQFSRDPVACLERNATRYGRTILIEPEIGGRHRRPPILFLIGAAANREVLNATGSLCPMGIWPVRAPHGSAQDNLRRTYLGTYGAEHARLTRPVEPQLERGHVMALFDQAKAITFEETADWPNAGVADVYALARALAQRYAFALLFKEPDLARIRRFGALLAAYHAANWSRSANLLRLDVPGTAYRRVLRLADELQTFVLAWMDERRGCPADSDMRAAVSHACDESGMRLAPKRAASHLAGFALAAYETTSATLAYALLLLALHPEAMHRLRSEIGSLGPIRDVDQPQLEALPLLDGVINETLRLLTPVPILGFRTVRPVEFSGVDLPTRATVLISPHLTHRLPEIYANPRRFEPERWMRIRPNTYEFLPFSGGPRRCPGYLFARNNLKLALAVILSRWRFAVPPKLHIDRAYAAVTVPKRDVKLVLQPATAAAWAAAPASPSGTLLSMIDAARA